MGELEEDSGFDMPRQKTLARNSAVQCRSPPLPGPPLVKLIPLTPTCSPIAECSVKRCAIIWLVFLLDFEVQLIASTLKSKHRRPWMLSGKSCPITWKTIFRRCQ